MVRRKNIYWTLIKVTFTPKMYGYENKMSRSTKPLKDDTLQSLVLHNRTCTIRIQLDTNGTAVTLHLLSLHVR